MRIRKGDKVQVLSGKDRGKQSHVLRAIPAEGRVIVEGVHVAKKSAKPTRATMQGGLIDKFMPVSLSSVAIARIRDFRGLSPRSFDGHGNYTFGVTEQLIFPEIDYDRVDTTRGMDITIATTARTDEEGRALLAAFGFPFRQENQ